MSAPIAIIDSGLGGLTVARAIRQRLPGEDIIYFGDTARLPYGSKSPQTVTRFVAQIIGHLRRYEPKHLVIACNTATALALPTLRGMFPDLSLSGVIDPGAKAAVVAAGVKATPVIGVLATDATIRSGAYDRAIHSRRRHARLITRAAPLLVPIIEEGRATTDPLVRLAIEQYLRPMIQRGLDVLLLGCTHYPILKTLFAELTGERVVVIDSAEQCADDVARRLASQTALPIDAANPGRFDCLVTDDPTKFARLARRFLGMEIPEPQWVAAESLYEPAFLEPRTAFNA